MDYYERAEKLRQALHFPELLKDLPNEMLIVALTPASDSPVLPAAITDVTGETNHEAYEFLGDAVLELIIADYLYFSRHNIVKGAEGLTLLKQATIKNVNLGTIFGDLCHLIIHPKEGELEMRTTLKVCADIFEAIIGVVYVYLRVNNVPNIIDIIQDWLINTLDIIPIQETSTLKTLKHPVTALYELYKKPQYKWGTPVYKTIQQPRPGKPARWVIGIKCPKAIKCRAGKEYIGIGTEWKKSEAKRMASAEALAVLEGMGYS